METFSRRAASITCALLGADEHAFERSDLLETGVNLRQIDSLYPLNFDSIEATLRAHIDQGSRFTSLSSELSKELQEADDAYWVSLKIDNQLLALDVLDGIDERNEDLAEHIAASSYTISNRPATLFEVNQIKEDLLKVSQIGEDLLLVWYGLWYVLHSHSTPKPELERHLVRLLDSLLPDLLPERVVQPPSLQIESHWAELTEIILPHHAERAGLLADHVLEPAIDALYPETFERFTTEIMEALEGEGGTAHLHPNQVSAGQWARIVEISIRICRTLDPEGEAYLREWNFGSSPYISDAIYGELRLWHDTDLASACTNAYNHALFAAYKLVRDPSLRAKVDAAEADELAKWLIEALLPSVMVGSRTPV